MKKKSVEPPPPVSQSVKLTDDWVPLPTDILRHLGWANGDVLDVIPLVNGQIVIRKKGALNRL